MIICLKKAEVSTVKPNVLYLSMLRDRLEILVAIIFNLIPILGVAFFDWAPFEMFWLFWMETLIIAFFNTIRVLYSQGKPAGHFRNEPLTLNFKSAIGYLLLRIIIFLFYAIFIIVFIGILGSSGSNGVKALGAIAFLNKLFNLALLLMFVSQAYYITRYFFMNREYYYSKASDYASIFDGRQIVIHIAVVLGAVGGTFLFREKDSYAAAVWTISVFCILKCILDLYFISSRWKRAAIETSGSI